MSPIPLPRSSNAVAAKTFRLRIFVVCALLAFCASLTAARSRQEAPVKSRITTAAGVRVRTAPQTTSQEMAKLQLGVVVEVLERSTEKEKIGATEDYWYRVAAPGGVEGWVFGGLTAPFDPQRSSETYLKIANARLKIEETNFGERADLYRFLERVAPEVKERAAVAEIEMLRLLALHQTLAAMPFDKLDSAPYKDWMKEHEKLIVYSEPAGQWYVRADTLWALEKKYRGLPIAERIAWEASRLPLPGECEGYLPCYLSLISQTDGEYLKLYPRGAHAGEALGDISEFLDRVLEDLQGANPVYEVPAEDRAAFRATVAELGVSVTRVRHSKGAEVLKKLDQLAARFR